MKFPDESIPKVNAYALAFLGFSSLCFNLIFMTFIIFSWDYSLLCLVAVPWGILFLIANIQTYLTCRKKYIRGVLSQPSATFIAVEAVIVNASPIVFGGVTDIAGALLGPSNKSWVADLTLWEFVSGSVFFAMFVFPFNVLAVLVSIAALVLIRRKKTWNYSPSV